MITRVLNTPNPQKNTFQDVDKTEVSERNHETNKFIKDLFGLASLISLLMWKKLLGSCNEAKNKKMVLPTKKEKEKNGKGSSEDLLSSF